MYSRNLQLGASYKVLRVHPDSVPTDSLAFCPFCSLPSQTDRQKGPNFAVLPLGLKNLSAAQINKTKITPMLLYFSSFERLPAHYLD